MTIPTRRSARVLGALAVCLALTASAGAQNTPGGNLHDNSGLNGSLSRADVERLSGPNANTAAAQDTPEARARVQALGVQLLGKSNVACQSPEITLVVSGTNRSASTGQTQDAKVYEAACHDGLGYLLETRGSDAPLVVSCFAAEAGRVVDEQIGRPPGFFCKMPQNRDVKATAATLLAGAGTACAVREWRWYGKSVTSQSEYSEVACEGGAGYVLRTPMPGSQTAPTVTSCADAVRQGISCRLTAVAPPPPEPTLDSFRAALAQNGVACKVDQLREIGREQIHKRYVVEYLCANTPASRVALIPLADNDNPFQVLTCTTAADIGVECALKPRP